MIIILSTYHQAIVNATPQADGALSKPGHAMVQDDYPRGRLISQEGTASRLSAEHFDLLESGRAGVP